MPGGQIDNYCHVLSLIALGELLKNKENEEREKNNKSNLSMSDSHLIINTTRLMTMGHGVLKSSMKHVIVAVEG